MRDPMDIVDSPGCSAQLNFFFLSFWQLGLRIFLVGEA